MYALSTILMTKFFETSPISKEHCNSVAATIDGGRETVEPTPLQGSSSYTVQVGNGTNRFIVQFRKPESPLDMKVLAAARQTYGKLVPACEHLVGTLDPLHVYRMNDASGDALLFARFTLHRPEKFHLLSQTVQDFAV